jgi:lipopolysaccharide/colanic/teichoic acid biosynthesis glycosyltransferase
MSLYDNKLTSRSNRASTLHDVIRTLGRDRRARRVFDVVAATMGLILFSPILLITSIAIKLDSRGPILIRETLFGYENRPIQVLKFRLVRDCSENDRTSPRLTRVGRIIRWTGIEELPRLFNVLSGEMSIVGPHPHPHPRASLNRAKPGVTRWSAIVGFAPREQRISDVP